MNKTIQAFCAKCQKVTAHQGSVDQNGEYVFHCTAVSVADPKNAEGTVYHHFFKLPASFDLTGLSGYLATHEEANKGQVSLEEQEQKLSDALATVQEEQKTPEPTTPAA